MSAKSNKWEVNHPYRLPSAAVQKQWDNAIKPDQTLAGDVYVLMAKGQIDPNFPLSAVFPGSPLSYLLSRDKEPKFFIDQGIIVKAILDKGVELRCRDALGMLPAEWAIMSNNQEAAMDVIFKSYEIFKNKFSSYSLQLLPTGYFSTEPNPDVRFERYQQMLINHPAVGKKIIDELGNDMSERDYFYWSNPYPVPYIKMTAPSEGFLKEWRDATSDLNLNPNEDISAAVIQALHERLLPLKMRAANIARGFDSK